MEPDIASLLFSSLVKYVKHIQAKAAKRNCLQSRDDDERVHVLADMHDASTSIVLACFMDNRKLIKLSVVNSNTCEYVSEYTNEGCKCALRADTHIYIYII